MAYLAIKGHATRGKEVIEILEMLGGINTAHFDGENTGLAYYIEVDKSICCIDIETKYHKEFYKITLEEFLEKFPYKVGDKVMVVRSKNTYIISQMIWNGNEVVYALSFSGNNICWFTAKELRLFEDDWHKAVFEANEHACNISLNITKEGNTGNGITYDEIDFNRCPAADKVHLILGNNYEIKEENGNYYVVRKKPQYPKTYEECCKVVNASPHVSLVYDKSKGQTYSYDIDNLHIYENIRKLKICRDAYWKIAGKEMGLDKSWEPNWTTFEGMPAIFRFRYNIVCDSIKNQHCLLVFPTEEMANAFYENFKEEIETCKEFL